MNGNSGENGVGDMVARISSLGLSLLLSSILVLFIVYLGLEVSRQTKSVDETFRVVHVGDMPCVVWNEWKSNGDITCDWGEWNHDGFPIKIITNDVIRPYRR